MPSAFALQRLIDLGAPLNDKARVLGSVQREFATRSTAADGEFVLAAGRLTPEKGFGDVLEACRAVNLPLVIAGDGPQKAELEAQGHATFVGHVAPAELRALRQRAAVAVVPSRYAEILPLAALESMAAALPTVAAASGGLTEAVPAEGLYPAGRHRRARRPPHGLVAQRGGRRARAPAAARARSAPDVIADQLRAVYGATSTPARY